MQARDIEFPAPIRLAILADRRANLRTGTLRVMTSAFLTCVSTAALTQTLPTGGSVAAGSASISSPGAGTLNINQSSNQAIVNWQSFSVGQGSTVNFNQPGASSATLNRVTGSTPSSIAGTINAPGTVLLVNPNGIAITKSGVVNTGSFAASTLDIKNEDFLAGRYKFTGNGSSATVTNAGRINVSDGGFAALLGGRVANDGVITARLGKVGLGSGEMITLDMSGDGFVSVAVPSNQLGNLRDGTGKALVSNRGKIRADGGTVFLSAATASTLLRDAVNVPGSIRANSVGTQNGRIVIGGGAGGRVSISGRLAANGRHSGGNIAVSGAAVRLSGKVTANGKTGGSIGIASNGDLAVSGTIAATGSAGQGGRIDLAGADIKVVGAKIDASGATGGGLVRIGGTFQGGHGNPGDPLYRSFVGRFGALTDITSARTVSIDAGSTIDVSAKASGDAGTAVVWSDQATSFSGTILGNGGSAGGHGGFAEVSSKGVLEYLGTTNLLASAGNTGTLLLDPNDLIISTAATSNAGSAPNYTANTTTSYLRNTDLQTALGTASVSVTATGKITVNSAITWTAGTTLTMTSGDELAINASITNTNTGSALVLKSTGAAVYFQSGTTNVYSITATGSNPGFGSIISSGSNVISNGAGNVTLNAGADGMNLNGGITTGTLTLNSAGWVTQVAALNATNLLLKGTGDFDLTTAGNKFSLLAANTTGRVNIYNGSTTDWAIGTVGGVNGVTASTLSLQIGTGRTVTQSQAINVSNLTLRNSSGNSAATYTLTNANNRVGSFAARVGTSSVIKLYGTGGLTIASVFYDANNAIGGVASVGTLTISNTGSVIQSNSIFATNLELLGVGGSYVLTSASNNVTTLAANTGSVNFVRNAGGLATVTLNGTVGITTTGDVILTSAGNVTVGTTGAINAGGAVALTTTGAATDIAINGAISTPTNSVTLSSRRNVTQGAAGTISAARLLLLGAGGSHTLTNAGNSIGTLAANTGTVNFNNNAALIVGSVASTTGVTTTGAVTLKTTGATSDIAINAAIATPGVFTLSSGRNITATGSVNVGSYIQQAGNWSQVAGVLPSFSATDFRITGGSFLRALGGTGAAATPYLIADVYGLQGMGTSTTLLTNSFKLANNIDAAGTSGWNAGAGFVPVGTSGAPNRFSGKFDGAGHTINGLFIKWDPLESTCRHASLSIL